MPSPRLPAAGGRLTRVFVALARRQYGEPIVESTEVYAHHPRLAMAFVRFNRAVEKPDAVPKRLKELASLKAATMVECEFCIDIGSHLVRDEGITDAHLLALGRPHESGLFTEEELLVLDFARAASLTPAEVTDEQVEALRARFGDKGVVELAHMVAWENARARLNGALGIGAGGFSEGRVCALPEREALRAPAEAPAVAGAG